MVMERKGKITPCEGCRERKKKCSAGQPCERCMRLGIQCFYLKSVTPPRIDRSDSARSQELQHHVEVLDDILRNMERELHLLKIPLVGQNEKNNTCIMSNSMPSIADKFLNIRSPHEKSRNISSDLSAPSSALVPTRKTTTVQPSAATSSPKAGVVESSSAFSSNWQIKLRKDGTISITTDILNYANLSKHLEALGISSTAKLTTPLIRQPTLGSLSASGGYLHRRVLPSSLRKGNFKAILSCIKDLDEKEQQKMRQLATTTTVNAASSSTLSFGTGNITSLLPPTASLPLTSSNYSPPTIAATTTSDIRNTAVSNTIINVTAPPIVAEIPDIVSRLVNAYFTCQFFNRVICHQKTFYDLFIRNKQSNEINSSLVPCSIAAAVLTMHCQSATASRGSYLFGHCDPNTTNFGYKVPPAEISTTDSSPKDSNYQHCTTDHTLQTTSNTILANFEPYFKAGTDLKFKKVLKKTATNKYIGEYETFKRLHAGLQDIIQFIQFINNQRGVPVKSAPTIGARQQENVHTYRHLYLNSYSPIPLPDENKQTIRALLMEYFLGRLSAIVCPFFNRVRWGEDDRIPLSFLIKTEEDLTYLYHRLPLDYQLSPSIFEDGISDLEFATRLKEDGRCDIVSVAIAERYYQSLLAVHEPFLPVINRVSSSFPSSDNVGKSADETASSISLLIGDEIRLQREQQQKLNQLRSKKRRKGTKSSDNTATSTKSSSKHFFSDSSDEEHDSEEEFDPNAVLSIHALRAQKVCFKYAVTIVRLLDYRCNILECCAISRPTLLSAWDFLMRNSCLGMTDEQLVASNVHQFLSKEEIEKSRDYALRCIEILRRGYLFNNAERGVWEHYEELERQLLMALGRKKPPTATYWEPL
ncbi:hypothetical protein BDF20DRAFT_831265 [Mycotypha africana]|uniref:uncharacterized protein n=1 Tax=Mycotypha africana TaxID=64632 RepID=UPI002300AD74|nr:uncharacterized protein BDF20DRAFT_831265 [Mycotypha africana]KAI8991202.1 hypothetical protein BDF20DRAFT_831265 [Mycotypha africana]